MSSHEQQVRASTTWQIFIGMLWWFLWSPWATRQSQSRRRYHVHWTFGQIRRTKIAQKTAERFKITGNNWSVAPCVESWCAQTKRWGSKSLGLIPWVVTWLPWLCLRGLRLPTKESIERKKNEEEREHLVRMPVERYIRRLNWDCVDSGCKPQVSCYSAATNVADTHS